MTIYPVEFHRRLEQKWASRIDQVLIDVFNRTPPRNPNDDDGEHRREIPMMTMVRTRTKEWMRMKISPTNRRSSANPTKTSRSGTATCPNTHVRERECQDAERLTCISQTFKDRRARDAHSDYARYRRQYSAVSWQSHNICLTEMPSNAVAVLLRSGRDQPSSWARWTFRRETGSAAYPAPPS